LRRDDDGDSGSGTPRVDIRGVDIPDAGTPAARVPDARIPDHGVPHSNTQQDAKMLPAADASHPAHRQRKLSQTHSRTATARTRKESSSKCRSLSAMVVAITWMTR